ncbi:MAG: sodium ion-translocating decarboxylase subunit beta [Gammaproteobacteria bacterium]|nr:sodium ion-translocating decarboxylase subunit beta [Gammaproteobacteria bacterium]
MSQLLEIVQASGLYQISLGQCVMIAIGLLLLYLAIARRFEPLLLVPIGFGGILANIPGAEIATGDGILNLIYLVGVDTAVFPLLVFMGIGALTDFGPLLANPRTLVLGAAAQFGIFGTLLGAVGLTELGVMDFTLREAAAISIIGGADGPTAIYVAEQLAPHLMGAIAVAAYSYMALVPLIQPPIMRLLTTAQERQIEMTQPREVSRRERILFPLALLLVVGLVLPTAAPLLGMFCFGNLMRECGVVDRLTDTARNALINTVTIFLGLAIGSRLGAEQFLTTGTLGVLLLGVAAFAIGTASGILMAKGMNLVFKRPVNPLIGAAGVSAVPMAARVVSRVGQDANPGNLLLMHAMGPNVAGVIGSTVAAGVLILLAG